MGLQNDQHKPTRMSPFTLTYKMETIIPTEIGILTLRTGIPEQANAEAVTKGLDMADEIREAKTVSVASY